MKKINHFKGFVLIAITAFCQSAFCADQITLQFTKPHDQGEVGVHSQMALPVSGMYPEYVIQQSSNMVNWTTVAEPIPGSVGVSDEFLRVSVPTAGNQIFYRVSAKVKMAAAGNNFGDAIFGYGTAFGQEQQQLGQLSLADFVTLYAPTNQYLSQITFNPTTAEYWNLYNIDPAVWNATNTYENRRLHDFRLNAQESAVFQTNGFVVSQRMQRKSFADVYYDIYTDELPVYVTTDSILQAWHRSFITILAEIEDTGFQPTLSNLIVSMSSQVPALWAQATGTAMANGVLDADYFLAVARSLSSGVNNFGSLGQNARVTTTLNAINAQTPATINLFGEDRTVDFSQFIVRGHYANSPTLTRYFRTMIWCGLADFRYAGMSNGAIGGTNTLRELSGAVALELLLRNSGGLSNWMQFNRTLEAYVGTPDSLTFAQLNGLLVSAGINSPANLSTTAALTNLQNQLMTGQLGMQQIANGLYYSPLSAEQVKLPRSFTFMGQRFAVDSWALGKNVFDSILWNENGITDKVLRRVPSALDVAFSVLGNSQVVPEIAARIGRTNLTVADGRAFWRDGHPYQHNLAAVRNVIDSQNPGAWTNTIYNRWLACLRELSNPTTDPKFPESMRTRAWAMKTVNTQLASWTHLRYATALYVKESYTPIFLCLYPKGYVEPIPAFYSRIGEMAAATKSVLATLPTNGTYNYTHYTNNAQGIPRPYIVSVSAATMHTNRLALMDHYVSTMETLRAISEKELSKTPLSTNETLFIKHLVEFDYTGARTYDGWYPKLFYQPGSEYVPIDFSGGTRDTGDEKGSDYWDALVTTVHTDLPDANVGDTGSILHQAVGNVHLLMAAVDCGPGDLAVYAGPVLSHYEFEMGPTTRMTDAQWKTAVTNNTIPAAPEWTQSYLVPSP